jgi:hypothetical protein
VSSTVQAIAEIKCELGELWLPHIYRSKILSTRTRAFSIGSISKRAQIEIKYTLLGIVLQLGRRRIICPDLATARFLALFARLGCNDIAIPYDISTIDNAAAELETSLQHMLLFAGRASVGRSAVFHSRLHSALLSAIRAEIVASGAGNLFPRFDKSTRQRTS